MRKPTSKHKSGCRHQLSSCVAAVDVSAARDRSFSGPLGALWSGVDIILTPLDRRETGLYNDCKNVTLVCTWNFYYFFYSPDRLDDSINFALVFAHHPSRQSGYTWTGFGGDSSFCRASAVICPGENRPTPSKLTVGIPAIVSIKE